jgi:hypothetical protein
MTAEPTCKILNKNMTVLDWTNEGYTWEDFSVKYDENTKRWCYQYPKYLNMFNASSILCLGNEWYNGYDVGTCTELLMSRLAVISKVTRIGTEYKLKSEIDLSLVPETLDWCASHYVPPIKEFITCERFGNSDGMDGTCHWCREMTPYQWEMCSDESWVRGLMSPAARVSVNSREEAAEFIESYKQKLLETWEELPPIFVTSAEKSIGESELIAYIEGINRDLTNRG